jgi:hypothetical protein
MVSPSTAGINNNQAQNSSTSMGSGPTLPPADRSNLMQTLKESAQQGYDLVRGGAAQVMDRAAQVAASKPAQALAAFLEGFGRGGASSGQKKDETDPANPLTTQVSAGKPSANPEQDSKTEPPVNPGKRKDEEEGTGNPS